MFPAKHLHPDEYELLRETTHESRLANDESESASHLLSGEPVWTRRLPGWPLNVWRPLATRQHRTRNAPHKPARSRIKPYRTCSPRSVLRTFVLLSYTFLAVVVAAVVITGLFFPSYTKLPVHYEQLRQQAGASKAAGRGNLGQEKVFIAASIFDHDGHLASGDWATSVLDLIDLLGPENAYLSIYENDAGRDAEKALARLEKRVMCNHSLIFEDHLNLDTLPRVTLPDGSSRIKRISYLAEVRNRALRPLDQAPVKFDKLLYLNDIVFSPLDALQLLFSTNQDRHGKSDYRAACAVDFISPFKFYDTFATRDAEGYSMGTPFFPFFTAAGEAQSRSEIMDGSDAVMVRSCWGGMVAFGAKYFQDAGVDSMDLETAASESPLGTAAPYKFRAEQDLYWDASECCLIQADIQNPDPSDTGIYVNPFVRVAYDTNTLSWLSFTRRFESLYPPIHFLVDILAGMPRENPRRDEVPWHHTTESIWVPDSALAAGGSFQAVDRLAGHAGFCGRRSLPVIKESPITGERNWEFAPIPP